MTDVYINRGRFGNHLTDVVGYTFDADTYCPDCTAKRYADKWTKDGWISEDAVDSENNPVHPIFAESEWDSPAHCSDCHTMLDGISLTPDGYVYVEDAIREEIRDYMKSEIVTLWRDEWGDYLFDDEERDGILSMFDNLPKREEVTR